MTLLDPPSNALIQAAYGLRAGTFDILQIITPEVWVHWLPKPETQLELCTHIPRGACPVQASHTYVTIAVIKHADDPKPQLARLPAKLRRDVGVTERRRYRKLVGNGPWDVTFELIGETPK